MKIIEKRINRIMILFLIILLMLTMIPLNRNNSIVSAATNYNFTSKFISGGGDITTKFSVKIAGRNLNGLCTHGGPNSERSGRCEAIRLSRTSDRFYLAYYYGYKKGWTSGANGCDLARAFHYAKHGYAYHQSSSRSEMLIKNAKSYCKEYGVPDNFVAFHCKPVDGSQEFVTWGYYPDGSFSLVKKSTEKNALKTGAYTFKNIKYKIYEKKSTNSQCVGTITLKSDGTSAKVKLAPDGNKSKTYYIKEYSTNSSYELNDTWYSFTISPGENKKLIVKDSPEYGSLTFNKEIIVNGKGNVSTDGYVFKLTNNNDSSVNYTVFSNNGKVSFSKILMGTYTLTEELTAEQIASGITAVTEPQIVTISSGENTLNDNNTFTNTYEAPERNAVIIKKTVDDGGNGEGFSFTVRNETTGFSQTAVTDSNGMIRLEDVSAGQYTVTENLSGTQEIMYVQPDTQSKTLREEETASIVFTFENKTVRHPVKLKKMSSDGQIEGISFTITGTKYAETDIKEKIEPIIAVTDANGEIDFGELVPGKYIVEETGFNKDSYINEYQIDGYSNPAIELEVTEKGVLSGGELLKNNTIEFRNKSHKVKLKKNEVLVDGTETDNPVSNAEYTLYRKTIDENGKIKEVFVDTYNTDNNGTFTIDTIETGDYVLYETVVPAGYLEETVTAEDPITGEEILKPESIQFTVDKDTETIYLEDSNRQSAGTIFIVKSDDSGKPLEEVQFTLFADEECTEIVKNNAGKELVKTTDRYGFAIFENIPWGTYYLKETEVPRGYTGIDTLKKVVIGYDDETGMINVDHEFHLTNNRKTGAIELLKIDEEGNVIKEPAVFDLYKETGELIKSDLKTGEDNDKNGEKDGEGKIAVKNLSWGNYYFLEKKAPAGYAISDKKIRVAVNAMSTSAVQNVTAVNPMKTKYVIATKKLRAEDIWFPNGTPTFFFELKGINAAGEEKSYSRSVTFSEEYVKKHTDEDGYVSLAATFADIDAGKYTLSELEVSRYIFEKIETESLVNGTINNDGKSVSFDLMDNNEYGAATFINKNYETSGYSSSVMINNVIQKQAIYSGLVVEYTGKVFEANMPVDNFSDYIKAYAIYDDGSEEAVDILDCSVVDIDGNVFTRTPKVEGTYTLKITHIKEGVSNSDLIQIKVAAPEMITVHFETNGGSLLDDIKVYKYDTLNDASLDSSKYTPVKEEYDFAGWYKDKEFKENFSATDSQVTEEITLYADWITQYKNRALVLEDGSLVFAYLKDSDVQKGTYDNVHIKASYKGFDAANYSDATDVPWNKYKEFIKSVTVADELKPLYTSYWFSGMSNVESIDLRLLDTSSTILMTNMFEGMNELEMIKVSNNFSWGTGHGLPTPTEKYINFADGLWYSDKDRIGYTANSLQSNIADTYYAFPVSEVINELATRADDFDGTLSDNTRKYETERTRFNMNGIKEEYIKVKIVSGAEKSISKTSGYGDLMDLDISGDINGAIDLYRHLGTAGHQMTGNYSTWMLPYSRYLLNNTVHFGVKNLSSYDSAPAAKIYVLYLEK